MQRVSWPQVQFQESQTRSMIGPALVIGPYANPHSVTKGVECNDWQPSQEALTWLGVREGKQWETSSPQKMKTCPADIIVDVLCKIMQVKFGPSTPHLSLFLSPSASVLMIPHAAHHHPKNRKGRTLLSHPLQFPFWRTHFLLKTSLMRFLFWNDRS